MSSLDLFLGGLREEVRSLPLYNSGLSSEYVRDKYHVGKIAKLGSNENPYGASPVVHAAVDAAVAGMALYSDSGCADLRSTLAHHLDVAPERLAFGNGSEDLIAVAVHTFLSPGDELVTIAPSFGLHVLHAQAVGVHIHAVPVCADFALDLDRFLGAMGPRTRMVILSNPSNPTGASITAEDMRRILDAVPPEAILVFDEAYFEYASAFDSYPAFLPMLQASNVTWLVLRTFSKAYGLAGLRVGYGIASDATLVDLMDRIRSPFNVNRLAQVAAIAALGEQAFMKDCVRRTVEERERVRAALLRMGYTSSPSVANFLYFDARENASELAEKLLAYGVIVKPWREPGYGAYIRVTIGSPEANDQFLEALAAAGNRMRL